MLRVPRVGEAFPAPSPSPQPGPSPCPRVGGVWYQNLPKMGVFPAFPLLHLPPLVIFGELIHSDRQHKVLCTKELQTRTEGGFGVTLVPPSSSESSFVRAGEGRQQLRSFVHPTKSKCGDIREPWAENPSPRKQQDESQPTPPGFAAK